MDTISWNMFSVVEGRVVIMTGRPSCIGVGAVRERGLFPTYSRNKSERYDWFTV